MADRSVPYLLIGGGIASANCARHLREEGADGEIVIVGREADPPYDRPPLSKGYLRGDESRDDLLFRPGSWYEEQGIELVTRTSVMSLDTDQRVARLSNKQEIAWDKVLLATGANVRILHVEGAQLEGIHYLRTLRNTDALREELGQAERVALIGGSFIGTELAASFTALGKRCALVMMEPVVHERFAGPEVGRFFEDLLTQHGVVVHPAQELDRFEGSDGRVTRLITKSGLEIPCDFVVIGAGVLPEVRLAEKAGLDVGGGVRVNRHLETSTPGVFAAGDIAEYDSVLHGSRLRVEHWDVAFNHGRYAALNMLGRKKPYDVVPYFWSDLSDWASLECVGPPRDWEEIWLRGSLEEASFSAWYLRADRLVGALAVGRSDDLAVAARLLREEGDLKGMRAQVEDLGSDLAALHPERR